MRTEAITIVLLALALVFFACHHSSGGSGDGADDNSTSDADADSDADGDGDDDDDDDDDECSYDPYCYCEEYCYSSNSEVQSDPPGTPATVEAICADTASPVVSTSAAVVELDAPDGLLNAADGFVRIPEGLRDRVAGLPEISFGVEQSPWATCEITALEADEGGFGFHVTWSQISNYADCDEGISFAFISCRIRFQMECGLADGGLEPDAGEPDGGTVDLVEVEALTYLEWCYDDGCEEPNWYSSGEVCPFVLFWEWMDCCE